MGQGEWALLISLSVQKEYFLLHSCSPTKDKFEDVHLSSMLQRPYCFADGGMKYFWKSEHVQERAECEDMLQ